MELRVYPFDELAAIRFEFEVLDKRRRALIEKYGARDVGGPLHQRCLYSWCPCSGGLCPRLALQGKKTDEDSARRQEAELELV